MGNNNGTKNCILLEISITVTVVPTKGECILALSICHTAIQPATHIKSQEVGLQQPLATR